jgi:hypothetical protein
VSLLLNVVLAMHRPIASTPYQLCVTFGPSPFTYLQGSSQPFEDNRFAEVSPSGIPPRRPMPPAAAPAMRAAGQ